MNLISSATCRYQVSLRFLLDRVTMRHMHYAVDNLDLDTVFPVLTTHISNSASLEIEECLESLKSSELNARQRDAISSVFDDTCLKVTPPTPCILSQTTPTAVDAFPCPGSIWMWQDPSPD